jgi:hypothetical protein
MLRAALVLIAPAAGCAKRGERDFALLRLFDAGCHAAMVEVAGEARPAVELASGELLACEVVLPREPCWLDVEAARRDDAPAALSGAPLLLDVALIAGSERTTLLHALPSPGTKPTALGWTHSRIEIARHLGEGVRLEFRLAPPPQEVASPAPPRFALADPRLSPRVDANERPWSVVDWLAPGPDAEELAQPDAAKRWPGYARVAVATPDAEVVPARRHRDGTAATGALAAAVELELFGCERPGDPGEVARRVCDRFARTEPLGPFTPERDDPALHALARLDLAVRADRARALGERTIQCELARPRRAPLLVEITSSRAASACDAALLRLQEFLAANGLLERTLFVVRTPPAAGLASGRGLAIARIPRGFRLAAPAAIVERLDEIAFEVSGR